MEQFWMRELLYFAQRSDQLLHIVSVDGAEIAQAEGFEKRARSECGLESVLEFPDCVLCGVSELVVQKRDGVPDEFSGSVVGLVERDIDQMGFESARARRDCHLVVVEDDQHIAFQIAEMVHGFESHASGHAAVADDCDDLLPGAGEVPCGCYACGSRNGGRCMAGTERIVRAFGDFRKSGQAAILAVGVHSILSSRKDFMDVCLMADVPYDLVARRVVDVMQCNRQFHYAQSGGEMASVFCDEVDDFLTTLFCKQQQFGYREVVHVFRGVNRRKQRAAPGTGNLKGIRHVVFIRFAKTLLRMFQCTMHSNRSFSYRVPYQPVCFTFP